MTKALVIIDMIKGEMKFVNDPKLILKNQIRLIEAFKEKRLPVILVQPSTKKIVKNSVMTRLWGDYTRDIEGMEVIPELKKFKYDLVLSKPEYDIFYNTDFESYCKKKKIGELYFAGIYTGCCVFFSSASAAIRKIQPFLISDAAGSPRKDMVGKHWHHDTLIRYKLMIGPVVTTNDVIEEIKHPAKHG